MTSNNNSNDVIPERAFAAAEQAPLPAYRRRKHLAALFIMRSGLYYRDRDLQAAVEAITSAEQYWLQPDMRLLMRKTKVSSSGAFCYVLLFIGFTRLPPSFLRSNKTSIIVLLAVERFTASGADPEC